MVILARFGVDAAFLGKVGDDATGELIVQTLTMEGVDTSAMVYEEGGISQSCYTIVESSTGRKKTYFTRGTVSPPTPADFHEDVLDGVDLLHIDGSAPAAQLKLMRAARERGIPTVLDAELPDETIAPLVSYCDTLVASERFASQFTGEGALEAMCRALLERGPQTVVVTLGDEGSVAMRREDNIMIRCVAHPVEVFDTTGAGDVFHGAFIYGVVQRWELERAVKFANIAAGMCCATLGGRSSQLSVEAVLEHLSE